MKAFKSKKQLVSKTLASLESFKKKKGSLMHAQELEKIVRTFLKRCYECESSWSTQELVTCLNQKHISHAAKVEIPIFLFKLEEILHVKKTISAPQYKDLLLQAQKAIQSTLEHH